MCQFEDNKLCCLLHDQYVMTNFLPEEDNYKNILK